MLTPRQKNRRQTIDARNPYYTRLDASLKGASDWGSVVNCYTYDPWGLPVGNETQETVSNMYLFANYAWDSEILEYHCFRRQYDPVLARFTSRDPVNGSHGEPMTLHKYLYCLNNPINRIDPMGLWYEHIHRSFGNWGGGWDRQKQLERIEKGCGRNACSPFCVTAGVGPAGPPKAGKLRPPKRRRVKFHISGR